MPRFKINIFAVFVGLEPFFYKPFVWCFRGSGVCAVFGDIFAIEQRFEIINALVPFVKLEKLTFGDLIGRKAYFSVIAYRHIFSVCFGFYGNIVVSVIKGKRFLVKVHFKCFSYRNGIRCHACVPVTVIFISYRPCNKNFSLFSADR